ncbi:TadE/TadG family type IV pilus assembly protein [Rhodobacter maris]|nr:TadE/TadG family type IV pilus assembly protein [Rhodobacter maris]
MTAHQPRKHRMPRALPPRPVRRRIGDLLRDEEGGLLILSLQLFVVMMICTGVAIDFVRIEERRAVIQNTLDRASLAAASLSQDLDPELVVQDYLEKAGLGALKVTTTVDEGNFDEWRRVTVTTKDNMPTIFGPLVGLESLSTAGRSQALESVGNVEISLVLDISGSMSGTKISRLRNAASDFVETMFDTVQPEGAPAGRLSMSIIPYNQQVVLGDDFASLLNLSTDHTENTCADVELLSDGDFQISDTTPLLRTMHGDSYPNSGSLSNCVESSKAEVLAFSNSETALKSKISGLSAGGNTSIDFGARWGLALLDPAAQPILDAMIANGTASSDLDGRPFAYDDGSQDIDDIALKVMVLMTDGQNTSAYSTGADYRTGNAGVYSGYFVSTKSATAFASSSNSAYWNYLYYYVPGKSAPYYSMKNKTWSSNLSGTIHPITWQTVWDYNDKLYTIISTFLVPPIASWKGWGSSTAYNKIYDLMAIQSVSSDKDDALDALCTAAKDQNITIFTMAVDAPSSSIELLASCATAETYAYDIDTDQIDDAFASIAAAVNALRLTN